MATQKVSGFVAGATVTLTKKSATPGVATEGAAIGPFTADANGEIVATGLTMGSHYIAEGSSGRKVNVVVSPQRQDVSWDDRLGLRNEEGSVEIPRQASASVWAIGDSLTLGVSPGLSYDNAVYSGIGQGGIWYQAGSWVTWALLASGARWTMRGVFATGGLTAAQILATHVPQVIAAAEPGDTVVVLAGTNGGVLADVQRIHETLAAAGLRTVAVTIPPSTSSTLAAQYAFNEALKTYAAANAIPLVDAHNELVDPATGAYLAAYNSGDGVHPSNAGAKALGETIAAVLNTLIPRPVTLVNHNAAMAGQLQTKPLALGAPANGVDFSNLSALGTSTIAAAAVAGFKGGNGYVFTRGDTDINAKMANFTLVGGRRYRIGMALIAALAGGSWGMRLESNTTGLKIPWGLGYSTNIAQAVALSRFFSEFTMPTGLPDYVYRLRLSVAGASTVLSLGEVTLEDLTVTGA